MSTTSDLIILSHADYLRLKRELKDAGLDLCYMAQAGQPVRVKWTPDLFQQEDFLDQVLHRRPADPSYRIASVAYYKKATWFQPDQFTVTFHGVSPRQDADLQRFLSEHEVQSSSRILRDMLEKTS